MVHTKNHNERCKDCTERVKQLLEEIFGKVEVNYDLNLPARYFRELFWCSLNPKNKTDKEKFKRLILNNMDVTA